MPGDSEQKKAEQTALSKVAPQLRPGIYTDISADDYHNDVCETPSLSASIASILVNQSPAHAYAAHPRLGGYRRKPTKEMDAGTLLHALLLGEDARIEVIDEKDWRKKVAKEAQAAAVKASRVPVLKHQFERAGELADRLRGKLLTLGYDLREYEHEVTMVWNETASDGTIVPCRGRADALRVPKALDLKSSVSASPASIARSFVSFGYDIQASAYESALEHLHPEMAGRIDIDFLFFEQVPPYVVTPCAPDGTMRELGESKWRRAIEMWAFYTKSGVWPEYVVDDKAMIPAPTWALRQELGVEGSELL